MSQSTEIIDIRFEDPHEKGEPATPFAMKGRHLRFIGWHREYTFVVDKEALTIEGPFQDDNPNAKELYQVSRSVAGHWIDIRYGKIRIRIPGRGKWGIDVSDSPNFELYTARLQCWMSLAHGEEALLMVEDGLRRIMYRRPGLYAFLQFLSVGVVGFGVAMFGTSGLAASCANLTMGLLFTTVFYLVAVRQNRFGLYLGTILNLLLLALPVLETYTLGERSITLGFTFPIFVPFCLSPTAVLIPLAMSAYGYVLMDHPRQRKLINRRTE